MFNLNLAKAAIENKPEFSCVEKDGYVVIDYNVQNKDTFVSSSEMETKILQNLRGTCFDPITGEITRLGFHKFHNLNENEEYSNIDFSKPNYVMEKLDGSCIFPIRLNGSSYRLGTRAGVTDVSMKCENWLVSDLERYSRYHTFISLMTNRWYTPIFEYVAPDNKIVVDYESSDLILTAIRSTKTGLYMDYDFVSQCGKTYGIPVVGLHDISVLSQVKDWKDKEGIVVAFEDGFRVKVKGDWYVNLHRAYDMMRFEKDVVKLILTGQIDDILPSLDKDKKEQILEFSSSLTKRISDFESEVIDVSKQLCLDTQSRKEYAVSVASNHKRISSFMFAAYEGKKNFVFDYVLKMCSSSSKIEEARNLVGFNPWKM